MTIQKTIITLFTLYCFSLPAIADKPIAPAHITGATNLTAEQVVERLQTTPELVVIDARRSEEYAKGHIEGAITLLDTDMTEALLAKYVRSKTTPVLFYCNGERCLRSTNAAQKALAWGYLNVFWFRGGWQEWFEKELPIAK